MISKLTNDIVSIVAEDKPLIYISEEAINLKRDNDKLKRENKELKNIIKELREYITNNSIYYNTSDGCQWVDQFKVLEILDKEIDYE